MRNSHEAFRSAIKVMDEVLNGEEENKSEFQQLWVNYNRGLQQHMSMEEHDVMPWLDEIGQGSVTEAGTHEMHIKDEELVDHVNEALKAEDGAVNWGKVAEQFLIWKAAHIHHFEVEEKVWMPLTQKTGATPKERSIHFHEKVITPAFGRDADEFERYLAWCTGLLAQYGSTQQPPIVATKVFVRGLHAACDKNQWERIMPKVRSACEEKAPEIWKELVDKFNIEFIDESTHLVKPSVPASAPAPAPAPSAAPAAAPAPADAPANKVHKAELVVEEPTANSNQTEKAAAPAPQTTAAQSRSCCTIA